MTPRSKPLRFLVSEIEKATVIGDGNPEIIGIRYDSRKVRQGDLFVAIPGLQSDGRKFIVDAASRGASAVMIQESPEPSLTIPQIVVPNARKALAEVSWSFFDHPERQLTMIAVTGTNGKTTVANSLAKILTFCGLPTAVCGTLGAKFGDLDSESVRTTPESSELAEFMFEARQRGATHAVMEVTSIGMVLERVWKIPFHAAIFTNLTRDHLDFHGTWEAYRDAKCRLFTELSKDSVAIVNCDDSEAEQFLKSAHCRTVTYGIHSIADYRSLNPNLSRQGVHFTLATPKGNININAPLLGQFNVYNILASAACAAELELSINQISNAIRELSPVRGRAEVLPSTAPFTVLVDYAHTPDALRNILLTLTEIRERNIHTVVGAGGDRDKGKRPQMARIAEELSDKLYLTSDNPRSENPESILEDMRAGLIHPERALMDADRRQAIHRALRDAREGDIVLIAGKGHETYQEISGVKCPFDDRKVALEWLDKAGYTM